jgi:HTH-type transcriptional regulator/antitoxin HigA
MITNDVQYRSTKAHLRKFEDALANLRAAEGNKPTKLQRLEIEAVSAQAEDLRAEIREYEALSSGTVSTFEASSLGGLASLLIKARIARGWSQRRLADELGVAEQQVQRYEATEYRAASLARICDVAAALGVDIVETARLRDRSAA